MVGVLCSPPDQTSYIQAGNAIFDVILREGEHASFTDTERYHRRGNFPALNFGAMHGFGTTQPINLGNGKGIGVLLNVATRSKLAMPMLRDPEG